MSIEELFAEIAAAGFRVNNLFEVRTTSWQVNLTDGENNTIFVIAESPEEALRGALASLREELVPVRRPVPVPRPGSSPGPLPFLEDLL